MTFYQKLQLNQAGSKEMVKQAKTAKEKAYHLFVYMFKIAITLAFCVAFVTVYSKVFGNSNSIVGVVVLLSVMTFRFADFGIHAPHAVSSLMVIWTIMTFDPRLANAGNLFTELLVNIVCILVLMVLGCYNVVMCNQSTLLLGYLLLYGYDVTGKDFLMRVLGMLVGGILTGVVFYKNNKHQKYEKTLRDLFQEFHLRDSRTKWQICVTLGVSSVIFIAGLLNLPRAMWVGIASMSVLVPFRDKIKARVKGRIPGNIMGGIGVGLSATYGCQAIFNSWGAISIAMTFSRVEGAIFYRIFNNAFGACYAMIFDKLYFKILEHLPEKETVKA